MNRRTFLVGLLSFALPVACSEKPKLASIPPGKTVLAFGDSVTFGTGASSGEDWPSLLAARTGWQIENAGLSGDTAEAAKERIEGLLDEHRPVFVIIELGGNDFLRHRSQKAVKEDLRQIIGRVKRSGAQVVLVAVPELSALGVIAGKVGDAPIYRELADEEKIPVVSNVFSEILSQPGLCADKIHPNSKGYQHMAAGIHAYLKKAGAF